MKELKELLPLTLVASIIGVVLCAVIILVVVRNFYKKFSEKHEKGDRLAYAKIIEDVVRAFVILGAALLILQMCGVNVTSVFAGLGIASAVVGLAIQDFLKDVVMGMHIMADKFYSVGDGVVFDGEEGIICEFSMKTTKIQMLKDGSVLSVCNRNIDKIVKLSEELVLDVPLPYDEPQEKISEFLNAVCAKTLRNEWVKECTFKGTQSFARSAIMYRISAICVPEKRAEVHRAINGIIKKELENTNIKIPFEQLDVHFDK